MQKIRNSVKTNKSMYAKTNVTFPEDGKNILKNIKCNSNISKNEIYLFNFKLLKDLGEGTFGKVKLARDISNDRNVALKIIDKNKIKGKGGKSCSIERVRAEARIMSLMDHSNLCRLYEAIETENEIILVLEYIEGEELFDYIRKQKHIKEHEVKIIFRNIVNGVSYLHKNKIIHRDLKPENVIIRRTKLGFIIKIIDFGFSRAYSNTNFCTDHCGSPYYASPEMILAKEYIGPEVDIWSLGILLYVMLYNIFPFKGKNITELYVNVLKGKFSLKSNTSAEAKDLIIKMICLDGKKRIKMNEIIDHKWMKLSEEYNEVLESSSPLCNVQHLNLMLKKNWENEINNKISHLQNDFIESTQKINETETFEDQKNYCKKKALNVQNLHSNINKIEKGEYRFDINDYGCKSPQRKNNHENHDNNLAKKPKIDNIFEHENTKNENRLHPKNKCIANRFQTNDIQSNIHERNNFPNPKNELNREKNNNKDIFDKKIENLINQASLLIKKSKENIPITSKYKNTSVFNQNDKIPSETKNNCFYIENNGGKSTLADPIIRMKNINLNSLPNPIQNCTINVHKSFENRRNLKILSKLELFGFDKRSILINIYDHFSTESCFYRMIENLIKNGIPLNKIGKIYSTGEYISDLKRKKISTCIRTDIEIKRYNRNNDNLPNIEIIDQHYCKKAIYSKVAYIEKCKPYELKNNLHVLSNLQNNNKKNIDNNNSCARKNPERLYYLNMEMGDKSRLYNNNIAYKNDLKYCKIVNKPIFEAEKIVCSYIQNHKMRMYKTGIELRVIAVSETHIVFTIFLKAIDIVRTEISLFLVHGNDTKFFEFVTMSILNTLNQ